MTEENKNLPVVTGEERLPRAHTIRAYIPATIADAVTLAAALYKSGFLPQEVKTPEAAFAILAKGAELGFAPMQSFDLICVVRQRADGTGGRPALTAAGMRALCLARPDICKYFTRLEASAITATFETQRQGDPKPVKMTFTIEEAKRAGLMRPDSGWVKFPERMLEARASAALARLVYADLVGGIYTPEEVEEFTAPETATPLAPSPTTPPAAPTSAQDAPPDKTGEDEDTSPPSDLYADLLVMLQEATKETLVEIWGLKVVPQKSKLTADEFKGLTAMKNKRKKELGL